MNGESLGIPSPPTPGQTVTCTVCRQAVTEVSYCDLDGGCGKPYCYDPDTAEGCGGASLALVQDAREWCYEHDPHLPPDAKEGLVRERLRLADAQRTRRRRMRARLEEIRKTASRFAAPGDRDMDQP